jgi:hypothetical protein
MCDLIILLKEAQDTVESHRREVSGALHVAAVLAAVLAYQGNDSR